MTRYCRLALSVAVVATLGLLGTVRPNGAMPPLLAQGASAQRRPLLTLSRVITSASSATSSPSGCSTRAGSTRCCTRASRSTTSSSAISASPATRLRTRLRSKNFGTPDEWLSANAESIGGYQENRLRGANTKADVIFAFFGYNESYGGDAGLPAFRQQLDEWIKHTLAQKYNGKSAPRIVLFSPIAHEDLRNPDLPDGRENNVRLELLHRGHGRRWRRRAACRSSTCSRRPGRCSTANRTPLTIDGVHLNEEGNRRLAEIIDRELFGAADAHLLAGLHLGAAAGGRRQELPWFNRYRTTDAFATFGDRAFLTFIRTNPRDVNPSRVAINKEDVLPTNYEVLEREVEVLDTMTATATSGSGAPRAASSPIPPRSKVDDSNTPPFINAGTNKPGKGPNGAHIFLGGEEAIRR